MAITTKYNEYQYKEIYSDVDIELNKQNDGDILRDTDIEAIKNSLINIITTKPGERRMLPTFAQGIYNLLFEPMDEETAERLGNAMLEAINIWDDRVNVVGINVNANYDLNLYEVTCDFYIKGFNVNYEPVTVNFILQSQ